MAWNTLRTNYGAEAFPSADLNDITQNINTLRSPASANYELNEGANYTTTSTTFVDVDATNLALSITTTGEDVMIHFHGTVGSSNATQVHFDVDIDGARTGGDDGIVSTGAGNAVTSVQAVTFTRLVTGLSAASHTFKLQWHSHQGGPGTSTLYAGAGTTYADVHPQFWVREVS